MPPAKPHSSTFASKLVDIKFVLLESSRLWLSRIVLLESLQKKSAKVQKQIAQITSQVQSGGTPEERKKAAERAQREKEKAAAEAAKREAAALFKPVQAQKVPFGVDPKTVVCVYFKQGICEKGCQRIGVRCSDAG